MQLASGRYKLWQSELLDKMGMMALLVLVILAVMAYNTVPAASQATGELFSSIIFIAFLKGGGGREGQN